MSLGAVSIQAPDATYYCKLVSVGVTITCSLHKKKVPTRAPSCGLMVLRSVQSFRRSEHGLAKDLLSNITRVFYYRLLIER